MGLPDFLFLLSQQKDRSARNQHGTKPQHDRLIIPGRRRHGGRRVGGLVVCLDRHIAHIIEPSLAVEEAIVGSQSVVALLGGHAVTVAAGDVAEAAAVHIVAGQRIQNRQAVLDEAAILGRVDAQSGQRNDDLSAGLAVLGAPAAEAAGSAACSACSIRSFLRTLPDRNSSAVT